MYLPQVASAVGYSVVVEVVQEKLDFVVVETFAVVVVEKVYDVVVVEERFDVVLERLVVDEAAATFVLVQHCSSAAAQRQVLNKFKV